MDASRVGLNGARGAHGAGGAGAVDTMGVLLIRHGQSEWNLSGRWQGQADPALTDLGREQARRAARAVGDMAAIWSSDLSRAAETAAIISAELGVGPVVLDSDLREREVGEWSGLTRDEIHQHFPGYLSPTDGDSPDVWKPRRPPGWESDASVTLRLHRALVRLRREVGGGDVLVVSHAGLLYAAERELGADGSRLGNLEGVRLELDVPGGAAGGAAAAGVDVVDELGPLSDIARLGGRVALLPADEITVPKLI